MADLGFGMAVGLQDNFSGPAQAVAAAFNDIESAADRASRQVDASSAMMSAGFQTIAVGMAVLAPVGLGVKIASEFETAEIGLTTLLGTTEEARAAMGQLQQDAARTPFQFKDLLQGERALIATGLSAEQARGDILALGEAVAASGGGSNELGRMAVNMQQIRNAGKASAMDIKQFAFAGINIYGLLADSMGVSTEKVKEMDISYEALTEALRKAGEEGGIYHGAMDRLSQSMAGKWSTVMDNFELTLAKFGEVLMPVLHPIIDGFIWLLEVIRSFAETGIGKVVLGVVVAFGALLVALGGTLVVMGLVNGASARLSLTMARMGMTAISTAFATGGLTGGLWAMATAAWAAIAPFLPFIAIGAAIVAMFWGLYEAMNSNNESLAKFGTIVAVMLGPIGALFAMLVQGKRALKEFDEVANGGEIKGGFFGFLQKAGGVLTAVMEIWQSATDETFSISGKTEAALKKLGILEFVIDLGTWVARIKNMFSGAMAGLAELWSVIKSAGDKVISSITGPFLSAFGKLGDALGKVFKAFGIMDTGMQKGKGSMQLWFDIGKKLIDFVLTPMKIGFTLLGSILSGFVNTVATVIDIIAWLIDSVVGFFTGEKSLATIGSEFVTGIWNGITGMWGWLTEQLIGLVRALPFGDKILEGLNIGQGPSVGGALPFGDKILEGLNIGQGPSVGGAPTIGPPAETTTDQVNQQTTANRVAGNSPTIVDKSTQSHSVENIHVQLNMDGDKMDEKLIEKKKFNDNRS